MLGELQATRRPSRSASAVCLGHSPHGRVGFVGDSRGSSRASAQVPDRSCLPTPCFPPPHLVGEARGGGRWRLQVRGNLCPPASLRFRPSRPESTTGVRRSGL